LIPLADAGEVCGKVGQPLRYEMRHFTLSLNAAAYGDHSADLLEHFRPDHDVDNPSLVSSRGGIHIWAGFSIWKVPSVTAYRRSEAALSSRWG